MESNSLWRELSAEIRERDADRRAGLLGGKAAARRARAKAKVKVRHGSRSLEGVFDRRAKLKGWYKGEEFSASLRRDGSISFSGQVHDTPSADHLTSPWRHEPGSGESQATSERVPRPMLR
jgi:hypothetical protein